MHISSILLALTGSLAVQATTTTKVSKCNAKTSTAPAKTGTAAASTSSATNVPGYDGPGSYIPSTVTGNNLTFGQHYAVLNLDLVNAIVGGVASTSQGQAFINNTKTWIDLVHAQKPPPLSIFSRIYFANARKPEIKPSSAFNMVTAGLTTENTTASQIYPAFTVDSAAGDVVVQKVGYYAGYQNTLEIILAAQSIDTVILSGIRTSGVILSTAYSLFDLGYKVYVIANNTIEGGAMGPEINKAILEGVIPKLPANVITIEQAVAALARSGPAIY